MKKNLDIFINGIIIFFLLGISILAIIKSWKEVVIGRISLTIDQNNREYIEGLLLENYDLEGTVTKLVEEHGLGEWSLQLLYEDGREERQTFNDGEMNELSKYMRESGYNEGKIAKTKLYISIVTISLTVIYAIVCLIISNEH